MKNNRTNAAIKKVELPLIIEEGSVMISLKSKVVFKRTEAEIVCYQ